MVYLLYNMKLLLWINSSTMQTKCILFCRKKYIYNNSPSFFFCSWIEFWVQTFLCILTGLFFSGTSRIITEVSTSPFDYILLVTPCCGFWWNCYGHYMPADMKAVRDHACVYGSYNSLDTCIVRNREVYHQFFLTKIGIGKSWKITRKSATI